MNEKALRILEYPKIIDNTGLPAPYGQGSVPQSDALL